MSTLCRGKVAFETDEAARYQLWHLRDLEHSKNAAAARRLQIYRCPICRLLHIGHKPKGKAAASKVYVPGRGD